MSIFELEKDRIVQLPETSFSAEGVKERQDLQRILRSRIEVLDPDLLIIAEEYGDWEESSVRSWRASRRTGGACTMICFSVFIAVVRAFMAVSRVILSWRIISTAPSAVLGMAVDCPASRDRAATSASMVSDLPAARRVRRSPRFTSTT